MSIKITYNWQILQRPIPNDKSLNEILKVPIRKPNQDILQNQSLNTTIQVASQESPLIPIIIAYRIDEGKQYQIDVEVKLENVKIKMLEKRWQNKSHIYVLIKMDDNEKYETVFNIIIFIKWGRPESKQLNELIKSNQVQKFVKIMGSRQTNLHAWHIYQKIKKEILISQPIEIQYKITNQYLLITITNKQPQQQNQLGFHLKKQEKKTVIIQSIEILNWLTTGIAQDKIRKASIQKMKKPFELKSAEKYNVLFKFSIGETGLIIPYLIKWRWNYCNQTFGLLKNITLNPQ